MPGSDILENLRKHPKLDNMQLPVVEEEYKIVKLSDDENNELLREILRKGKIESL